jgi:hypothetical protein
MAVFFNIDGTSRATIKVVDYFVVKQEPHLHVLPLPLPAGRMWDLIPTTQPSDSAFFLLNAALRTSQLVGRIAWKINDVH